MGLTHRDQRSALVYLLILLTGLALAAPAWAKRPIEVYKGSVSRVIDGDTVVFRADAPSSFELSKTIRVRLAQIDAPESRQPFGQESRRILKDMVYGRNGIELRVYDHDRYGRAIGTLYIQGTNINRQLIELGAAWVYGRYAWDPSIGPVMEAAREGRVGLWAAEPSQIIAPWKWRRTH